VLSSAPASIFVIISKSTPPKPAHSVHHVI
jgi:hypothetical protein